MPNDPRPPHQPDKQPHERIAIPGRDFHLPENIGQWGPFQLTEYIRSLFANDPTMLPASLALRNVTINNLNIKETVLGALPNGPGLVYQPTAGQATARWAGTANTGDEAVYNAATGSLIIGQTWDRSSLRGGIPTSPGANVSGWTSGASFYCAEDTLAVRAYNWTSLAANWNAAVVVAKVGIYGPINAGNAAAVPLLGSTVSDKTFWTGLGLAKTALAFSPSVALIGGNAYFIVNHLSWTGVPTTTPNFYIPPNTGALSTQNDPTAGAANLGSLASAIFLAGLTDLPATIDVSATRTNSSAVRMPWIAITSA